MKFEKAIIIRDKTRLEQLIERFNSKAQAKFFIERSGSDFDYYEDEHAIFYRSLKQVEKVASSYLKIKTIHRSFLPNYIFAKHDIILVIGQDGLVANTAKYVDGLPIIAINPDEDRFDGILLAHNSNNFSKAFKAVLDDKYTVRKVTMAKAELNDGQSLLAFNDFYIGTNSHISSRYKIRFGSKMENQSSSGIIVSTGAGSTGWLSSVINMTNNINKHFGNTSDIFTMRGEMKMNKLIFVVREPFQSKASKTDIGFGIIKNGAQLSIESQMPNKGVIFSDGIESDFLNFNSGSSVKIGIAKEKAMLVV